MLKDTALELLATDDGDPLLAFWPIGLGRTAVFASDVKDRWAANWVTWRGYGPFFTAVARALERRRPPAAALEVVPGPIHGTARSVAVSVEARDVNGRHRDLLRPVVQVQAADDAAARRGAEAGRARPLRSDTRRRREHSSQGDARRMRDTATAAGVGSRVVLPDPAAEYRFGPPDEERLRAIATATGGAWRPGPEALASVSGDRRIDRRPIWPALVAAALGLWFVDVLLRRIRVFEPSVAQATAIERL